jgi:hypothetical protein
MWLQSPAKGCMALRMRRCSKCASAKAERSLTLDRDFGQVLRYPPAGSAGIVVLEIGRRVTHAALLDRVRELLSVLKTQSPADALWIIEPGRLRIHLPTS